MLSLIRPDGLAQQIGDRAMARTNQQHARRRRGEGSIRPKGAGWEVRYLDGAGDRRSRSFDLERDAVAFLARANAARSSGELVGGSQLRLVDYLLGPDGTGVGPNGGWLGVHGPQLRASTVVFHRGCIDRYLVPVLGRVKLGELRGHHVLQLHNAMRARGLTAGTIRNAHSTLGAALSAAQRDRLISVNPARQIERPSVTPRTVKGVAIQPPTLLEIQRVQLELVDPYQLAYRVTVATGARLGEVLGLRWSDVATAGVISIGSAWSSVVMALESTKSAASVRARRVSPALSGALAGWRTQQAARGVDVSATAYVFPSSRAAGPMRHQGAERHLVAAQRRAGVRHFRWHDLRHAHATMLRERGDDLLTISRAMGHARVSITTDLYGHVDVVAVDPLELDG